MKQRTLSSMWIKRKFDTVEIAPISIDLTGSDCDAHAEEAAADNGLIPKSTSARVALNMLKRHQLDEDVRLEAPFPMQGMAHIGWDNDNCANQNVLSMGAGRGNGDSQVNSVADDDAFDIGHSRNNWSFSLLDDSLMGNCLNNIRDSSECHHIGDDDDDVDSPFCNEGVNVYMRSNDAQTVSEALCRLDTLLKSRLNQEVSDRTDEDDVKPARIRHQIERLLRQRACAPYALWSERYRARGVKEIVGNRRVGNLVRAWIEGRLTKIGLSDGDADALDDHRLDSACDSKEEAVDFIADECDEKVQRPCTAMILRGPIGIGKTSLAFACARELGTCILEVNSGNARDRTRLIGMVGEATRSRRLNILSRKEGRDESSSKKSRKRLRKLNESYKMPQVKHGSTSSVLIEEIDVSLHDDGFLNGVSNLLQTSQVPILLTCNELPRNALRFPAYLLDIDKPTTRETCLHLFMICVCEGVNPLLSIDDMINIVNHFGYDMRRALLLLQFALQQRASTAPRSNIQVDFDDQHRTCKLIIDSCRPLEDVELLFANYVGEQSQRSLDDLFMIADDLSSCDLWLTSSCDSASMHRDVHIHDQTHTLASSIISQHDQAHSPTHAGQLWFKPPSSDAFMNMCAQVRHHLDLDLVRTIELETEYVPFVAYICRIEKYRQMTCAFSHGRTRSG